MKGHGAGPALDHLDLNLLRVFDALRVEGSVSAAARRLRMTQPGASRALARLREALGDPLFVMANGGLSLTPYAERIAGHIHSALDLLTSGISQHAFEPRRSARGFTIAMSEYAEALLSAPLGRWLASEAPGVRLEIAAPSGHGMQMLDLCVGVEPVYGARTQTKKLVDDDFVAVARRAPAVPTTRSAEAATAEPVCIQRRGMLASVLLVLETDAIVVLPRRLARQLERRGLACVVPVAIGLDGFELRMHWHERYQVDDGHRWLRGVIGELASSL